MRLLASTTQRIAAAVAIAAAGVLLPAAALAAPALTGSPAAARRSLPPSRPATAPVTRSGWGWARARPG